MKRMTTAALVAVALLVGGAAASAQTPAGRKGAAAPPAKHTMIAAADMKWGPGPPALPPGAQATVLDGDPSKAGLFIIRLKFPDGYAIPAHSHPTAEHVVVVSGTLMAGFGDKMDEAEMHAITAGGYAKMPAGTNHFVKAKGETIVQVTAVGPFEVKYANPNDDPRKKTTAGR